MTRMDDILEMKAITREASCIIAGLLILIKIAGIWKNRLFENDQLFQEYKQKFFDYKKLFDI